MKGKIIFFILLLMASFVFGEAVRGVVFTNSTGYDISELYISPTSHDDWYDDLLEGQTLKDGESVTINIPDYDEPEMIFDARAVDIDGDEYSRFEIDFTNPNSRTLEFTFDDYDDSYGDDEYYAGDYDTGYNDGYKDAFRDSYSEAFKEGFRAGYEAAMELNQ